MSSLRIFSTSVTRIILTHTRVCVRTARATVRRAMGDDAPRAVIARLKAAAAGDARAFESMTVRRDGERRATTTARDFTNARTNASKRFCFH